MFDAKQCEDLKASLIPFSLDRSYDSTVSIPLCMQLYMEFYGFFDTVKALDVEYFWGIRQLKAPENSNKDSIGVATHYWQITDAKACIFLVHGLFDHVGLYQKLIRYLLLQGYSVVAIDLPGHGLSEGASTQINSFSEYADVFVQTYEYFQGSVGGVPSYALGQSTGAAVIMSTVFSAKLRHEQSMFEGLIFLGPLVRPRGSGLGRIAFRLLRKLIRQIKRDFNHPNSNDSDFHHFLQFHDPLQSRVLSIQWIGAMYEWVEEFAGQPEIETPLLIVQGTSDRVVDWRFNVAAIQEHFPQAQVAYVKGAMHHLANEANPWLKVVFSSVGQFIRRPQIKR